MQNTTHFVRGKKFFAEIDSAPSVAAGHPPPLSPKAQRLAEILLARSRAGTCVVSQYELCRLTGWSRVTVWRYLTELREKGLIRWDRRKRLPNVYRFADRLIDAKAAEHEALLPPALRQAVTQGHNVLILGPEGIGKTFQLSLLSQDGLSERVVLRLPGGTIRDVLTSLWDTLAELEAQRDVESTRKTVKELAAEVLSALSRSRRTFMVLADDVDRAPPSLRRFLLGLLSLYNVQVVATATDEAQVADLVDHFLVFPLPPLSQEQTARWVRDFVASRRIPVLGGERGLSKLQRLVYLRSQGNPRKIQALLKKIEAQGYVDRRSLREELLVGGRFQFVDMTWILILTAALALAIRYLSLGFHDRTLYVLAGLTYAAGMLMRWFSYQWRRKKK